MKRYACLLVFFLSACVSSQQAAELRATYQRTIPTCEGERDCRAKWEAAQLWVVHNAAYKIQTVTDVLIETYNSTDSSVDLAVRVTKEPLGDGRYAIVATPWCANIFGCARDPLAAAIDFNRYVAQAGTPPGPRIGVSVRNLDAKAQQMGGVVVEDVWPAGPAERAGVRVGDIIVAAGGQPITVTADLVRAVRAAGRGVIELRLWRDGREITVAVTPD